MAEHPASLDKDMDLLMRRVVASLQLQGADSVTRVSEDARRAAETLAPDGSWPDVDYTAKWHVGFQPLKHNARLHDMARAYAGGDAAAKGSPALKAKLIAALDYWLLHDFTSSGWWQNMIGVPLVLGGTLLLIEQELTPDQRARGAKILDRATVKDGIGSMGPEAGANLTWLAANQAYRGLLEHSPQVVADALKELFSEIRVVDCRGEGGIEADMSFHQHRAVLYTGGYGASYAETVTRWVEFTAGTRFAPSAEKVRLLKRFILDGTQWMVRGRVYDYGVVGREIVRRGKDARDLAACVRRLANLPGPRRKELSDFAARLDGDPCAPLLAGNRHFWKSDYMAHQRPTFLASARMYSTRVSNTDGPIIPENKKRHHLADGAAFVYRTGEEYRDIFPVWDWRLVPGATCEQSPAPLVPEQVRRLGSASFVGGVSDGLYGAAAMDLRYDSLSARKAWFFFDKEFVCLGTGISCPTGNPVLTSVNQCLLAGDVTVSGRAAPLAAGARDLAAVRWVEHDAVTYAFPQGGRVSVKIGEQTGAWADIGGGPAEPVTRPVFSLWLAHGNSPTDENYEYVVLPGCKGADSEAELRHVEVLSNTPELQAVRHNALNLLGAAFWKPGKLDAGPGCEISVDKPCLLLCRETKQGIELSLSNPENRPLDVKVTIPLSLSGKGCLPAGSGVAGLPAGRVEGLPAGRVEGLPAGRVEGLPVATGATAVWFALPEGDQAGSTLTRTLTRSS